MIRHKQVKTLGTDYINKKLDQFFEEDNISKDITTLSTQRKNTHVQAFFIAKEDLIFVGKQIISQGLKECSFKQIKKDGAFIKKGGCIAELSGPITFILKKERVILNLIQRLSGIASTTNKLAEKTNRLNIQLLDTRKTTPGLRRFEKYAVYIGGGTNHRFSLKDAVMIKDNHLIGNSNFDDSIKSAFEKNPDRDIQVEVDTQNQLKKALDTKATSILLDNFSPEILPEAISYIKSHKSGKRMYIELSGGINSKNIDSYCIKGVDGISMGALTHNIKSKDISLDLK
tara:strand:- start:51 stop:908 length:858 start_codon:yes stop_codon:yes gene_type:complete